MHSSIDTGALCVVFSSRSGNTEKLARVVSSSLSLPGPRRASDAPPEPGALTFFGFWIDKGAMDAESLAFLRRLDAAAAKAGRTARAALFGTMGGDPAGPRAKKYEKTVREALARECPHLAVVSLQLWQGRIAPEVVASLRALYPLSPAALRSIKEAAKHPDEKDEASAAAWALEVAAPAPAF